MISAFRDELLKISASRIPPELKASEHLTAPAVNWQEFEKDLKKPAIQKAMVDALRHHGVDPKLRKYVRVYGGYLNSNNVVAEVQSRTKPQKLYKIKRLENGRLGCECRDWQFVHSVKNSDCDHIKELKRSGSLQG